MRVIAVMSPKGGVGKTTTADALAYILGVERGKRVLVLDGDPQGDSSVTFGAYKEDGDGMSELLEDHVNVGGYFRTEELIERTQYKNQIDIIPANSKLMWTDAKLQQIENDALRLMRLKMALPEIADQYDYCICDCGRLLDIVVINMLMCTELIIAPFKVGGFETRALQELSERFKELKTGNDRLHVCALMTMRQKGKVTEIVEEWLHGEKSPIDAFETTIRKTAFAEQATLRQQPLPAVAGKRGAAEDYRKLVNELEERGWI